MKNIRINKLIANFFMAIILTTALSSFAFAKTVDLTNDQMSVASSNMTESANGLYTIGRYRTVNHRSYLYAGDYVKITLDGDGATNLDLYVYDRNGNLIGSRTSWSDYETLSLDIYKSGYFTVKVVNRGSTYNDYYLDVVRY